MPRFISWWFLSLLLSGHFVLHFIFGMWLPVIWCAILKKVYLYTLNCHFILYRYNKRSEHTSTFFILENKRRLIQFIVGISNSDFFLTGKVRSLFLNLEPFSKLAFTMNATSNATVVAQSMFLSCCSKTV